MYSMSPGSSLCVAISLFMRESSYGKLQKIALMSQYRAAHTGVALYFLLRGGNLLSYSKMQLYPHTSRRDECHLVTG